MGETMGHKLARRAMMGLVSLLVVALAACGSADSGLPDGGDNGGDGSGERVLTGQVTNSLTGQPVAGVTVSAAGQTATTAADGTFTLTGLPETGALTVTFTGENYSTTSVDVTDPSQAHLNVQQVPTIGGGTISQPPPPPDFDALTQ